MALPARIPRDREPDSRLFVPVGRASGKTAAKERERIMKAALRICSALIALTVSGSAMADSLLGTLYRSTECTCCEGHAAYLRENDIKLQVRTVPNLEKLTTDLGLPVAYHGCHTIVLSGYKIVGHVTAELIMKLINERPKDVVGISLRGMPAGVPGMPGPKTGDYEVYAVHDDGSETLWGVQ
jgi:hypothetical protein